MSVFLENSKQTAKKVASRTLWAVFIALLLAGIGYFIYRNYNYSSGNRAGILVKISKKGWFFKTNEGQLNLAGEGGIMNQQSIWDFSASEDVYQKLQSMEGKKVSLHYLQKVDAFPWQGDTDYIVDEAHLLE